MLKRISEWVYERRWDLFGFFLCCGIIVVVVTIGLIMRHFPNLQRVSSVSSSFTEVNKEFELLKKDISNLKSRIREVEHIIDEKMGDVFFSLAHSPIKDIEYIENLAIVPPS